MVIGATDKFVPASAPEFSESDLHECEAVLLLSSAFCSYAFFRSRDHRVMSFGYLTTESGHSGDSLVDTAARFISLLPFRPSKSKSVKVAVMGCRSMPVPNDVVRDFELSRSLFKAQFDEVIQSPIKHEGGDGFSVLYQLPDKLETAIHSNIPNARVAPALCFMKFPTVREPILRVVCTPDTLLLALFNDGKLQFTNEVSVRSETDMFYHIANTIKTLSVPQNAKILAGGMVNHSGELWKQLSRYYENAMMDTGHPSVDRGDTFRDVKMHYFAPMTWMR
jgi:hypothetical protein